MEAAYIRSYSGRLGKERNERSSNPGSAHRLGIWFSVVLNVGASGFTIRPDRSGIGGYQHCRCRGLGEGDRFFQLLSISYAAEEWRWNSQKKIRFATRWKEGSKRDEGCKSDEELDDACGGDGTNVVSDEYVSDYADVFGLSEQDIMRKVFRSEERAYDFYSKFGRCHGFGVRKGDYGKDEEGNLIRRRFFCNRAGLRDEKHLNRLDRKRGYRPETRTN
ncbi:hypothetical protein Ahy_B10g105930 [Arachis hypogaea]|uniref:FAR1 domain-containing protein n=1 Tax=Arachis hypogaea TaxID=3818 RepID=A0A444X981_ARAHY|nr:hypothetical protein Ahy_B10g105930 [Arachis hypogaea]